MGFALNFMRVGPDAVVDADRAALQAWLRGRGLEVEPGAGSGRHLRGSTGPLAFGDDVSDLHLDPLDQQDPVTGGLWHATLSPGECEFVYDLCVAGRMLVVNPQGAPLFVVPGRTHDRADLPESVTDDDIAWVGSGEELRDALTGGFDRFRAFRDDITAD